MNELPNGRRNTGAMRALGIRLPWAVTAGLWWWLARAGDSPGFGGVHLMLILGAAWLAWYALVRHVESLGRIERTVWIAAVYLPAFFATPVLEDDPFRFLWDGRQSAVTGNPYASTPLDHFADASVPEEFQAILDRINHPEIPTIYGPIFQAGFLISYLVAPGQLWPWKLLLVVVQLLTWRTIGRMAGDGRAALFGVCPLAVFETGFNAHPDALGVALVIAAILACHRGRTTLAGSLLGLAVAAKVFAILLAPFVLLRMNWRGRLACVLTAAGCYLPFWLQGSLADWNGLGAFASRWEFNSSVFALLGTGLGDAAARVLSAVTFAACWAALLLTHRRRNPGQWPRGDLVFGAFFLLSATVNPWYLLWMMPFVALHPTAWGRTALVVVSLSYLYAANLGDPAGGYQHPAWLRPVEYGLIAIAGIVDWCRRAKGSHVPRPARM